MELISSWKLENKQQQNSNNKKGNREIDKISLKKEYEPYKHKQQQRKHKTKEGGKTWKL